MSGYLLNLVRRAADDSRQFHPRLPSQFEPIAPGLNLGQGESENLAALWPRPEYDHEQPKPASAHEKTLHEPSISQVQVNFPQKQRVGESQLVPDATTTRYRAEQSGAGENGALSQVETIPPLKQKAAFDRAPELPPRADLPIVKPIEVATPMPPSPERRTPTENESRIADLLSQFRSIDPDGVLNSSDNKEEPSRTASPQPNAEQLHRAGHLAADNTATVSRTVLPPRHLDLNSIPERDVSVRQPPTELADSILERRPESASLRPAALRPSVPPPQRLRLMENDAGVPQQTINVSIGKIEIKAVSKNDAPRSQRRERPAVMSLDEYLSQNVLGGNP